MMRRRIRDSSRASASQLLIVVLATSCLLRCVAESTDPYARQIAKEAMRQGDRLFDMQLHAEAAVHYRRATKHAPNVPQVHMALGEALMQTGGVQTMTGAITAFGVAAALTEQRRGRQHFLANARLGISLVQAGRMVEAKSTLKAALATPADDATAGIQGEVWLNLGHTYQKMGLPGLSFQHYQRAVELAVSHLRRQEADKGLRGVLVEAMHKLAWHCYQSQQLGQALTYITQCISNATDADPPLQLELLHLRIAVLLSQGRYAAAAPFVQQYRVSNPSLRLDVKPQLHPELKSALAKTNKTFEVNDRRVTQLYKDPLVLTIDGFLSDEEVRAIRTLQAKSRDQHREETTLACFNNCLYDGLDPQEFLKRKQVRLMQQQRLVVGAGDATKICFNTSTDSVFKAMKLSKSTIILPEEDALIDMITQRIQLVTGLHSQYSTATQLLHYTSGGYGAHTDCRPELGQARRAFTVLVYLNSLEGGETEFVELGPLGIQPQKGKLVLFRNLNGHGICDIRSRHRAASMGRHQSKHVLQQWYFAQVPKEKHPVPDLDTGENLERWISCDLSHSCREYSSLRRPAAKHLRSSFNVVRV